jgi:hypothetical protein
MPLWCQPGGDEVGAIFVADIGEVTRFASAPITSGWFNAPTPAPFGLDKADQPSSTHSHDPFREADLERSPWSLGRCSVRTMGPVSGAGRVRRR